MVAPAGPPGFGDPASVEKLGAKAGQAGLTLETLKALVNKDVRATIPDLWGGDAADAMTKWMHKHLKFLTSPGSPEAAYDQALEEAAQTMAKAHEQLRQAVRYINNNDLYIDDGLTVHAYITQRPDAEAVVSAAQNQLNAAVKIAQLAQQQIKTANKVYEAEARKLIDDLVAIDQAMQGGVTLGARRRRQPPKKSKPGPRMPESRDERESGLLYGPEGPIRKPAPHRGTWSGTPGDSEWTPNNPREFGMLPGETIRWVQGVPDLSRYTPNPALMPGGASGVQQDMTLTKIRQIDNELGDERLASQSGWTLDEVTAWRQNNDYVWHHYSDTELQLVPGRIHRPLAHQGGVAD